MTYRIEFLSAAKREFASLPLKDQKRVDERICALANNPHPPQSKPLQGEEDLFRLRVGRYRVIYQVRNDMLVVLVLKVGHRRDVYRNL